MKIEILGVKIDQVTFPETLDLVEAWAKGDTQKFIATVNPEFLVLAQNNEEFKAVLNSADLATCDGFGLVLAGKFLRGIKLFRVTGSDLSLSLIESKKNKIFLLGGSEEVIKILNKKFSQANIAGSSAGGRLTGDYRLENNSAVIKEIKDSGAEVLLVAFGQIKQEFWIKNNLESLPNIKVAIGVGGTFDFLAGRLKRAPKWLRLLGLEWLYRLAKEPKRFKRIWNATAVFCWLVYKEKLK